MNRELTLDQADQAKACSGFARRLAQAAWNLAQAGILVYGLLVTGYLLGRVTVGERWNVIAFANNFVPWWALVGLLLGGIALFSRHRRWLVALQLPGVIAFVVLYGDLLWPRGTMARNANGQELTVATYNLLSSRSDPARVIQVMAALDADVIGLQEVGPLHASCIQQELAVEYPYQVWYPGLPVHGVGLVSRYPVLEETVILPLPNSMLHLRAVLDVNGTPVTVYIAHPAPPKNIFSPVTYNTEKRDAEITTLREAYLEDETGPLLVLGDFNMSDQNDAYRKLDCLLDDAFREAGRGLGFTFPCFGESFPPFLRIDYIWHDDQFVAYDATVADDNGTSDHRPVVAELVLKNGQTNP